ncbi:hypothetical protein SETIT_3G358500v2 [Setaria italica]|uniref:BTB domain-containing protein n=2 Tax=Setaria italica TaxID=4555 RepID=A0A368QML3_SETIT|nr:BTB/POZ and MATH domain-containing protein 1 [Setaria italica]RCV19122.1 hypothetical protein SETIT_3G358500v2 [Setaria italica]
MNMKHSCSGEDFPDEARYVHHLKIDDFAVTKDALRRDNEGYCIKSRCSVGGHEWEIRFYPAHWHLSYAYLVALELAFLGGGAPSRGVSATLTGRLVEYMGCNLRPLSAILPSQKVFQGASDSPLLLYIGTGEAKDVQPAGWLIVECTISVLRDKEAVGTPPASDLHRHLGELLRSEAGADVTFAVSGKSFAAHKNILAARSPVFKAEFFGDMEEKTSQRVEIKDMEPIVFEALLRFIYTDMVPAELDDNKQPEATAAGTVMAQHLLVAADRYGLDRLKVICEQRLALGIDIDTAASTLALAERHNCSGLKAKCIEFIAGTSAENLDAVLATEGYRHLEASSPSVLTELLKVANRRKSRSTYF